MMPPDPKVLFVPLKAEWFDQFEKGEKKWEHRLLRRQWNAAQVYTGRRVTLSRGYGKQARLHGTIVEVKIRALAEMPEDMSSYPGATAGDSFISFRVRLDRDQ